MSYKQLRQISSIVSLWHSIYIRQIWSLLKTTKLYTFLSPFIYIYIPMFIGINVFPSAPKRFRTAHLNLPFSCHTHYKYVYLHTEIKTN